MGFNDGRPAPTNTFDWGNTNLSATQQLYTRMFALNEANASDTLRLCNAGMTNPSGTISTNNKLNRSGFSFGPVQFDLSYGKNGKPVNSFSEQAFDQIIRNASDATGNPIFSDAEIRELIGKKAYRYKGYNNSPEAIAGRQIMLQYRDKIDQALQSEYGEQIVREATLKQFSALEKETRKIINRFKDQEVRDYLTGSQFARAVIADLINQRGYTGASQDIENIVNELKSNPAGMTDDGLTNAAKRLGRAHAAERISNIKKAISGQSIGPSSKSRNSYNLSIPPIDNKKSNDFKQSKTVPPPRRDPLVFDLDSDGIETVAVGGGILFDHNGDGIATGTGWIKGDDGLLVRDINSNGTIDSGRELFGDQTRLQSGATATDGFDALRDLDSNADGKIDAADAAFAELKIWRDLNQDGISQVDELTTLADAGIAAINLDAVARNQAQNGNVITATTICTICLIVLILVNIATGNVFAQDIKVITHKFNDKIELLCNEHKVSLVCKESRSINDDDSRKCNDNILVFENKSGNKVYVKSIRHNNIIKTPYSISCVSNNAGKYFVTVEFNGGYGFTSNISYDLFEESGKRLTINGKNFDKTMNKLKIPYTKHLEIEKE